MSLYFPGGQFFTHMIKSDLNYLPSANDETPKGGRPLPPSLPPQQLSPEFGFVRSVTYYKLP